MSVGKFRTGLILISIGLIFLLQTMDVIDIDFWRVIWKIWPVLLIAIGLEKIFTSTQTLKPLAFISPILIVAVIALAALRVGNVSFVHSEDDSGYASSDVYSWNETGSTGTERLDLNLKKAGGRLIIRNGAAGENLLEGELRYWGDQPHVRSDESGSTLNVLVEDRENEVDFDRRRDKWVLKIADKVPVAMSIDGGGARMRLDFTGIPLEDLDLEAGAVDIDLTFGSLRPLVNCAIQCGAAALDIVIPADAGVSIERESALSHFSTGGLALVERGSTLESPDYETRPVKINLRVDSGLSSLRVHRADKDDGDPST